MKVACIGNMNNWMFSLVRHLRDESYDTELLLLQEFNHFLPSNDTFKNDYKNFTYQLNWNQSNLHITSKNEINNILKKYDFLICCDVAPAFIHKSGRKADIFAPYGGDIYDLPFNWSRIKFNSLNLKKIYSTIVWNIRKINFKISQKRGIRNSKYVILDYTNEEFEKLIFKLNLKNKRIKKNIPYIYTKEISSILINNSHNKSKYENLSIELRRNNDLLLFQHGRHCWKNLPDRWSYKGNERLILALRQLKNNHPDLNFHLITCEYGPDIHESKKLITEHNLDSYVTWFPILPKKELMLCIKNAHIGIGEFGIGWFSYGTIFEFMSLGIPIIHHREVNSKIANLYDKLYPMVEAKNENEIYNALLGFVQNQNKYKKIGDDGLKWFNKYAISQPLEIIIDIINKETLQDD